MQAWSALARFWQHHHMYWEARLHIGSAMEMWMHFRALQRSSQASAGSTPCRCLCTCHVPFKTQPQPTAHVSCAACRGPTADSIDSRRRTEDSQGRLLTRLAHRLPRRLELQVLGLLQHCPILQPDPCLTLRRILPLPQHNYPRAMAPPRRRPVAAVACSCSMLQFSPRYQRLPSPLMH